MEPTPRVIGIVGWSGSGKTSLILRMLPLLVKRGMRVATIKHAHHEFDIDVPGKDSYEHRRAGAFEVIVSSSRRWAHVHESADGREASLSTLLQRVSPCDLVLVEGFKSEAHTKLEVHRPDLGKALLCTGDPQVVAVAANGDIGSLTVPILDLDDTEAIVAFILADAAPLEDRRK